MSTAISALLTLLFSFPLYCRYRKGVMPSHFAKVGHQARGGRWPVSMGSDTTAIASHAKTPATLGIFIDYIHKKTLQTLIAKVIVNN
jgi:hypothetical protein